MNSDERYDIFIAYSLVDYKNSKEARLQGTFINAKAIYNALTNWGYTCFLQEPDEPTRRYDKTPSMAAKCSLFLLVTDSTIIEKQKSIPSPKLAWWYNELIGFISQPFIGGKPEFAKDYIQVYTNDDELSDKEINRLHETFLHMNPLRTLDKLNEWIKSQDVVIPKDKTKNKHSKEKVCGGWDQEVADFWQDVFPPACPSKSELVFYEKYFNEVKQHCHVQPKVLILGSTKKFIELAINNHFAVTVVDSSEDYCHRVIDSVSIESQNNCKVVICDWANMNTHDSLKGSSYDIIIGDMAIGNIEPADFEITIKSISSLLKNNGYWLGKNLYQFSQEISFDSVKRSIKNHLISNDEITEDEVFSSTVYDIVMFSFATVSRSKNIIKYQKMDYNRLSEIANEISDSISNENSIDTTILKKTYEKFTRLKKKNLNFYVYHLKDFISELNNCGIQLYDIGYGDDFYRDRFPLLVLKKGTRENITKVKIEKALLAINSFLPRNQNKQYVNQWVNNYPSQYYLVRLSEFADMANDHIWKVKCDEIINDIIKSVKVHVDKSLTCFVDSLEDKKVDKEVLLIKNINTLSDNDKSQIKETYKLAVLLYLSSVLVDDQTEKLALFHLVVNKLFQSPQYNSVMKCWEPLGAPWITAKVCMAAFNLNIPENDREKTLLAIQKLIESYDDTHEHNWVCTVGSHMDTCALCVEAILNYYDSLLLEYKNKTKDVLLDILNAYVLNDNIYETIALHPLGRYAIEQLRINNIIQNEPYQKKVLGSVAFFSILLRIIAFFKKDTESNIDFKCYEEIILKHLLDFWELFSCLDETIYLNINKNDICTIPQILYSLSEALSSEKKAI